MKAKKKKSKKDKIIKNIIIVSICIVVIAILFNTKFVGGVIINGDSMSPTLKDGEAHYSTKNIIFFNHLLLDIPTIQNDDIIFFYSGGIMGQDTLDDSSIVFDTCLTDVINSNSEVSSECLNKDFLKGEEMYPSQNELIIKRVKYIEDINGDGVDDYYVRGDNRESRFASMDSKNMGFIDGNYVVGKLYK